MTAKINMCIESSSALKNRARRDELSLIATAKTDDTVINPVGQSDASLVYLSVLDLHSTLLESGSSITASFGFTY